MPHIIGSICESAEYPNLLPKLAYFAAYCASAKQDLPVSSLFKSTIGLYCGLRHIQSVVMHAPILHPSVPQHYGAYRESGGSKIVVTKLVRIMTKFSQNLANMTKYLRHQNLSSRIFHVEKSPPRHEKDSVHPSQSPATGPGATRSACMLRSPSASWPRRGRPSPGSQSLNRPPVGRDSLCPNVNTTWNICR